MFAAVEPCGSFDVVGNRATKRLEWHFDQAALDHETATDGWYCLLTDLDVAEADAAEVPARYKGQEVVERRYGASTGRWPWPPSS